MIAARSIAYVACVSVCLAVAGADVRRTPAPHAPAVSAAPLTPKVRLPGAEKMEINLIAALGRAWDEGELRDLVAAFRIKGKPVVNRGDLTTYLQNRALGIDLTFRYAEVLDVRLRDDPPGTLVLSNIRLYGPGSSSYAAFNGDLPFGLRFGDSRAALIARFGPPDLDGAPLDRTMMRWDTERYALFTQLDERGTLNRLSLQLPVVATNRPGFEER